MNGGKPVTARVSMLTLIDSNEKSPDIARGLATNPPEEPVLDAVSIHLKSKSCEES